MNMLILFYKAQEIFSNVSIVKVTFKHHVCMLNINVNKVKMQYCTEGTMPHVNMQTTADIVGGLAPWQLKEHHVPSHCQLMNLAAMSDT